ncbi:MAG: hypothetical protein ACM3MG_13215 [Bacillota bacterium]
MKLADIVTVVGNEFGTSDLKEINKLLKAEPAVKFRITGKALGHFGFTGLIKSLSEDGVKVFMTNKVSLIRLSDIETFEKAKPRAERPVHVKRPEVLAPSQPASVKGLTKKATALKASKPDIEDDKDFEDNDEEFDGFHAKKLKKGKIKAAGKSGSKFIPTAKK